MFQAPSLTSVDLYIEVDWLRVFCTQQIQQDLSSDLKSLSLPLI